MRRLLLLLALLLAIPVPAAQAGDDPALTVSAASDLLPAFEEIGPAFTAATGIDVSFNFGSTGQLAQQIEAGAPVDVFAAAHVSYIDRLDEAGLLLPETRAPCGQGQIVLWTPAGSPLRVETVEDLRDPGVERIAIANPDHAPYGAAARDALMAAGVWEDVEDRLVFGENISDTLRYAETGNVDVAIVALSLAIPGEGTWTIVPQALYPPIEQEMAVIASTGLPDEAHAFVAFVTGPEGREVMRRYGFLLPGEAVPGATPAATPAS